MSSIAQERDVHPSGTTPPGSWKAVVVEIRGALVAIAGLVVLLAIFGIASASIPSGRLQGQNIVSLATAGFGVIGAVIGAYFGVSAAGKARDQMSQARAEADQRTEQVTQQLGAARAEADQRTKEVSEHADRVAEVLQQVTSRPPS